MEIIAKIKSGFPTKFGIPRQSNIIKGLSAQIIFEPKYRNPDAIKGLEGYSHIWLIWEFNQSEKSSSLTVRPPRLGGNKRMGVFATRSPFRPNPIGLSCVKIEKIEHHNTLGEIIFVSGADLADGTPILDIKPYLPNVDCVPDAIGGFSEEVKDYALNVIVPDEIKNNFSQEFIDVVTQILAQDPRPSYQNDSNRIYGFYYEDTEIKFKVNNETLTVTSIEKALTSQ